MNALFKFLGEKERDKLQKKKQPQTIQPMLATLTNDRFSKEGWIFERKFDGERCLVFKNDKTVTLMSRNQKSINNQYPEIEAALKKMHGSFILDGEVVAFEGNLTSFSRLQKRMHRKMPDLDIAVYYYVFDIIYLYGHDLSGLPLRRRKSLLHKAIDFGSDTVRFTNHRNKDGESYFEESCKKHWEGVIAKYSESTYTKGRSRKWLKFKCENQQELVIGGYTDPEGERNQFGALLVGFYEQGNLKYAGKVGTGYDEKTLKMLHEKMKKIEQDNSPFEDAEIKEDHVHWLKPHLVGQFRYTEWTANHKLRHPSFLGLRRDKKAGEVEKEV